MTDTQGDVYAIQGLPEEVLAVVFAYVSRSPQSFRENLLEVSQERAEKFHEKWVLEYGHASVAEHAVLHLGVENLSRYASSVLEESRLISVTEYSQRYQEPGPGSFHLPRELEGRELAEPAGRLFRQSFSLYGELLKGLTGVLAPGMPRRRDEREESHRRRVRRLAFEDARYALPLATTTSLGLTVNARELEYVISKALTHPAAEMVRLGEALRGAASPIVPTLIRYAAPLPYLRELRKREEREAGETGEAGEASERAHESVRLVDFTGRGSESGEPRAQAGDAEITALRSVVGALILPRAPDSHTRASGRLERASRRELAEVFTRLIGSPGPHDPLPRALETVSYTFDLLLSEAAWHQLVRHRMMSAFPSEPRADRGITMPPRIEEAGLSPLVERAAESAESLWQDARVKAKEGAPYLVTNAHRRWVRVTLDLRQLYHLAVLRLSPRAQWDIRGVVGDMVAEARRVHPSLVAPALRRSERSRSDHRSDPSSLPPLC